MKKTSRKRELKIKVKTLEDDPLSFAVAESVKIYNTTLREIENIFEKKMKGKYPEGLLLMSSLIEELLRTLISHRFSFSSNSRHLTILTEEALEYADRLSFYGKIKTALLLGLVDENAYKNLESFRRQRNQIHNFFVKNNLPNYGQMYNLSRKIFEVLFKKHQYYINKIGY